MECNKDEALRAKDIAVKKFTEKNYAGAKKFAQKAQNLYPGLEGVAHMLTALEFYIIAENKVNGEMDMYGILGVSPMADDETIKKQYRKLVLLLHPDKNKFIGADGAFQLVSEAFNFLSDKVKRSAYNSRLNIRPGQQKVPSQSGFSAGPASFRQFQQKVPTQSGVSGAPPSTGRAVDQKVPTQGGVSGTSRTVEQTFRAAGGSASQQKAPPQSGTSGVSPGVNGYYKPPTNTSSRGKVRKTSTQKASTAAQGVFKREDTFWTVCTRCKMQYEYIRFYLNQTLKCPHCEVAFLAVEIPPPSNLSPVPPPQQYQKSSSSGSSGPHISRFNNSFGGTGARWSPLSGTTTYNNTGSGNSQSTSASQVVNEEVKRKHDEVQTAARWDKGNYSGSIFRGDDPFKKRREDGNFERGYGGTVPSQIGSANRESGMGFASRQSQQNVEAGRANVYQGFSSKLHVHRESPAVDLKKILSMKAVAEIHKRLSSEAARKGLVKVKRKQQMKAKREKTIDMQGLESRKESSETAKKSPLTNSAGDADAKQERADMIVPDPDFYLFDSDRSESCFGENQVWATYDDDDGMPRFYALIHEVISLNPFKVKISWLNSKSNSEFGPLDWTGRGFRKIYGEFRVGKHETNNMLNSFSHKVDWVKGPRGTVQIYPHKGDIWGLYRNWSPDWNEETADEIIHVYDMVEVLDDYNEEQGVSVAPLIKAAGFKTVFYKQPDPKEVKRIPKEEMFRFSHRVPSHVLTGEEKPNAPKGYVELDPAAISSDLLQVIDPAIEEQVMETDSRCS